MLKYTKTRQIYLFKGIFPTDVPSARGCFSYLEFVKIRLDYLIFLRFWDLSRRNKYFKILISIKGLMYFCSKTNKCNWN